MGRTRQTISINDIIKINRQMIKIYGGIFFENDNNLANRNSLEYTLAELDASLFGETLHTSVFEKAAILMWRIIVGHVFHDGNKRTGVATAAFLLRQHGYRLNLPIEIIDIAEGVATKTISLDDLQKWLEDNINTI